ncbi:MAG: type II toxin-antitoxin system RelE/ParE family toxin [Candidatus Giovannonibacteria bacterium]|nr:type II toxin-antitoxin system RelE/ParE family toxin [Candidatus Giovannonibacteria bacterium]
MRAVFHKNFKKQFKKLRKNEQNKFNAQLAIFIENPFDPLLNNHPLQGKYESFRSINIGGNLRAIYEMAEKDIAYFIAIDTHNKLYSS